MFTFAADVGDPWVEIPGAFLPPFLVDPMLDHPDEGWFVMGTNWTLDEGTACAPGSARADRLSGGDGSIGGATPTPSSRGERATLTSKRTCARRRTVPAATGWPRPWWALSPRNQGHQWSVPVSIPAACVDGAWDCTHTLAWVPRDPEDPSAGFLTVLDVGEQVADLVWPVHRRREARSPAVVPQEDACPCRPAGPLTEAPPHPSPDSH